jgi:hypothetical protein
LVGGLYSVAESLYQALISISQNSEIVKNDLSTFAGDIGTLQDQILNLTKQIEDYDKELNNLLTVLEKPTDIVTLTLKIFYGISIALASLSLVAVILMTFFNFVKLRYIMYFSCVILFFSALLGFIVAAIFSLVVPLYYWGCEWIVDTVGSQAGF